MRDKESPDKAVVKHVEVLEGVERSENDALVRKDTLLDKLLGIPSSFHAFLAAALTFLAVLVLWSVFHVWFFRRCESERRHSLKALDGALRVSDAAEKRHDAERRASRCSTP